VRHDKTRLEEAINHYLQKARSGDLGDALFGLIELDHTVLPLLEAAYRSERKSPIRALLVEAVWQHRQPSVVPFLFEALNDSDEETWQQALDGLVALASPETKDGLERMIRLEGHAKRREWFEEALGQIIDAISDCK
jgi:hypothetical protein